MTKSWFLLDFIQQTLERTIWKLVLSSEQQKSPHWSFKYMKFNKYLTNKINILYKVYFINLLHWITYVITYYKSILWKVPLTRKIFFVERFLFNSQTKRKQRNANKINTVYKLFLLASKIELTWEIVNPWVLCALVDVSTEPNLTVHWAWLFYLVLDFVGVPCAELSQFLV